jgi:outer membrane protein assembly factor BamB
MRTTILVLLTSGLLTPAALAQQEKHLLYMTTPDAAQPGGSGEGLMLFDIEDGHRFVRRIDVPSFKEGVRGINACAATGRLYVTTSTHRLICMDLKTDAVLWEHKYDTGCDRAAITPDGKTLYVADMNANKTYQFTIKDDGTLADKKLLFEAGSDGMTIDSAGNLYTTSGGPQQGVQIWNKDGKRLGNIPIGSANICFGGKDRNILFINSSTFVTGLLMKTHGVGPQ